MREADTFILRANAREHGARDVSDDAQTAAAGDGFSAFGWHYDTEIS